ncbi:ABC transporter ATP-binding protein [Reinekea marinisedimentorum]|uniref:ABC-2 type transport system ATP-binding protein n=1 Tax=Reinekea marinisedimentorum TaxID=230495 RepID=A0A4R3IEH6_9GAMM|nr:ABC transporter ATP-binding protein [Reinekea marinisedimentorum]TCS43191.1 ABC-2 type transport system ATP-binding protein [Reinekea marinisedimentorum]
MSRIIEVANLRKQFGRFTAVDDLSFSVTEGVCFGLLGPNGAGKTTTIEMLEGLVKPSRGEIKLFGEPANKKNRQRIGIQFQNTSLQDYLRVGETLRLFASFYAAPASIEDIIELCNLDDILGKDVRMLSGGQRQRLLLALALVNDPDLIFLDEPTTGLDPQARRNFWHLIDAIKQRGKTIVLTTHYMEEAQMLCDDVAIMDTGKFIARGKPEVLLAEHFKGMVIELPKQNLNGRNLTEPYAENGDKVEIYCEQVESSLSRLMQQQVPLTGMQVKQANLEDLFLKLTGHGLRG